MDNMTYTIEKPKFGLWTKALFGVVLLGLVGLGTVAYETFLLFQKPIIALAFAIIIELGAVTEALGLANGISKRTWWIVPGLIITLLVSGGYNYLTVARAGELLAPQVTNPLILATIGVGPLSSIFFMSIGLGFKVKEHEEEVQTWQLNKQAWEDKQRANEEQKRLAAQKLEQERIEKEQQLKVQLDYQKRKAEIEAEERLSLAEIASRERQEKREASLRLKELSAKEHEASLKIHEANTEASVNPQRGTYEDFLKAVHSNGNHEWSAKAIALTFHVTERTGFSWLARFKHESPNSVSTGSN